MFELKPITFAAVLALLLACEPAPAPDPEAAKFAELESSAEAYPGLFDFYRLKHTGELYMVLTPEQLEQDFLHLATLQDGIAAANAMRGRYAGKRVIRFERDYDKLKALQINTRAYFDPDSALSLAATANLVPTVLAVATITDENEQGDVLVKANAVFLSEALQRGDRQRLSLSGQISRFAAAT